MARTAVGLTLFISHLWEIIVFHSLIYNFLRAIGTWNFTCSKYQVEEIIPSQLFHCGGKCKLVVSPEWLFSKVIASTQKSIFSLLSYIAPLSSIFNFCSRHIVLSLIIITLVHALLFFWYLFKKCLFSLVFSFSTCDCPCVIFTL